MAAHRRCACPLSGLPVAPVARSSGTEFLASLGAALLGGLQLGGRAVFGRLLGCAMLPPLRAATVPSPVTSASTRGSGRPSAPLPTTLVLEGCAAGSMTYEAAFDAAQEWAAQWPWIRPERSFTECAHCSGAADACMQREQYSSVLVCNGLYEY